MTTKKLTITELRKIIKEEMSSPQNEMAQIVLSISLGEEPEISNKTKKSALQQLVGTCFESHYCWISISNNGSVEKFYGPNGADSVAKKCAILWSTGKTKEALSLAGKLEVTTSLDND